MNAHDTTARDLADALLGSPRARQTVRCVSSTFGGYSIFGGVRPPRHVVLVTPEGGEGEYYEVSDQTLDLLRAGRSPEWLELEPYEPEAE